jgi:ATP-dependent Clp protease ATP-binding subunit ClpA
MDDNLEQALEVDVLAAVLRMEHQESGELLEFLAKKLEQSLPQNTTVTRGGWFLSKEHPVQQITVSFDDYQYQIIRERHGAFTAKVMKLVRGVVLKTTEIPIDQWTDEVAQQLAHLAQRSAQTRSALNKFVVD